MFDDVQGWLESFRMFKKVVQKDRSEAHGVTNK